VNLGLRGMVSALALLAPRWTAESPTRRQAQTLAKAVQRLATGDLQARVGPPYANSEMGQLARALDGVASSLESCTMALRVHQGFRAVLDSAGVGIVNLDPRGVIAYANSAAATMLGYHPTDLVGQPAHDVWHPPRPDGSPCQTAVCPLLAPLEASVAGLEAEEVFWRRDGTRFRVQYANGPVRDERGQMVGAVITFHDVSRRRAAEDELRQRYYELAALNQVSEVVTLSLDTKVIAATALGSALWALDLDAGMVCYLDSGDQVLLPLATSGLPEKVQAEMASRPLPKVGEDLWGQVAQIGAPLVVEDLPGDPRVALESLKGSGLETYFGVPLKVQNRVVGVISCFSRSKRTFTHAHLSLATSIGGIVGMAIANASLFEQVQASEREWERTFGAMSDGVAILSPDLRIVRANSALARLLGTPAQALVGAYAYQSIEGQCAPTPDSPSVRCVAEKVPCELVRQEPRLDNRWLYVRAEPVLGPQSELLSVIYIARDITDERLLQEQYYQAQKMDTVGRLAGGVAHDFNNLLTAILGYTDMATLALPRESPARMYLEEVKAAGERAASVTRQLLAFSRRETVQPRIIDLGQVTHNLANMLRRLIREDIELSIVAPDGIWQVKADPSQMEQVVTNLAVNARDAMPDGGKLTIQIGNIRLDEANASRHAEVGCGDYVALSVSDTGIGMSEEVKAHIFEPFFTTKRQGTGLGLATCFGIVKQSGGHIRVDSEVGKGTTVSVYLPRTEEAAADLSDGVPTAVEVGGRETVLVVEDEEAVRDLIAKVLGQLGYHVLKAAQGEEALRLFGEHAAGSVHLILTDLVMPQMGGQELAERIAAQSTSTRMLFMSGYADGALSPTGELGPGVAFLRKPFTRTMLAQQVRAALDRSM